MSDALTDIARDETRGKLISEYLDCLLTYLKKPTKKNHRQVMKSAQQADDIPRGYFGSPTNLSKQLDDELEKLKQGDKTMWARFLAGFKETSSGIYKEFKQLSPFSNKLLIKIDYGMGFSTIKTEGFEEQAHRHLREQDYKAYDCDKYLLSLPISGGDLEKLFRSSDIIWLGCGRLGQMTPRKRDGSSRQKP